jgi:hypothetical protein
LCQGHLKNKCKGPHHGINKYPVAPASPLSRGLVPCRRGNPVLTPGAGWRIPQAAERTNHHTAENGIAQPAPWPWRHRRQSPSAAARAADALADRVKRHRRLPNEPTATRQRMAPRSPHHGHGGIGANPRQQRPGPLMPSRTG